MPEVLEVRSTGTVAGTRTTTRVGIQPIISTRSTRPVSVQDATWDASVTLLQERLDSEIVIEVNSATVVCSGVAFAAAAGALAGFFGLTNAPVNAGQHASNFDQPLRVQSPLTFHYEAFSDLRNTVWVPSHSSPFTFTQLPLGDVVAIGTSWWEDITHEVEVFRQTVWPTSRLGRSGQNTDVPYILYSSAEVADPSLVQTFNSLVAAWKAERSEIHSGSEIFVHLAYQKIIGLGMGAVRLILKELERELDHWFWALVAITREDPVPVEFKGNMLAMREYWLSWGRRQGYKW